MDSPGLRDVAIGHEEHMLQAALKKRFVLGYGEATWALAWRMYVTPPYRNADEVALAIFNLSMEFIRGRRK